MTMVCETQLVSRIITRRASKKTERKAKKSYTLSPESVAFLETLRKRRRQERAGIEKSVSAYYTSRSDQEVAEQAQWGEFALSEFPKEF